MPRMLRRFALLMAVWIAGCAAPAERTPAETRRPAPPPSPVEPITATDECATRMHDIAGGLLLFYAMHHDLPAKLEQLNTLAGFEDLGPYACPVSQRAYIYRPTGIYLAERNEQIILHDPAPSHSDFRWAISVNDPQAGAALVTRVIALPESFFLLHSK